MSQGVLCPNLTNKFQSKVSQNGQSQLPCAVAIGGLSVNLNHLKTNSPVLMKTMQVVIKLDYQEKRQIMTVMQTQVYLLIQQPLDPHRTRHGVTWIPMMLMTFTMEILRIIVCHQIT